LGTKAHQLTRKAIIRRAPTLLNGIKQFNEHIDTLQAMAESNPQCRIPIPDMLPSTTKELRICHHLHEDVWISKTANAEIPRWLTDVNLRAAVRAHLRLDRCYEERRCLGREADNLCRWFGRKFAALELASQCQQCSFLLYLSLTPSLTQI
ncbi:hypothetical protein C8J56DRAFT_774335, partial [Mycena floridula]